MIIDNKLDLGEITIPNAGNTDTDVLDFQAAKVAFGGGQLFLNAMVTVDGAVGTSSQIKVLDSPDASSWTNFLSSEDVQLADIKKGKVILGVSLPPDIKRYLKANVVGTGAFSAGKVRIWLAKEPIASIV